MSITVKKVTEKNTKKQILEEYDKAVKLIATLQSDLKKSSSVKETAPTPAPKKVAKEEKKASKPQEDISVANLIDNFNQFSNNIKDDMSREINVIDELKEQIEEKQDSIKNIYANDPITSLGTLIDSYKNLLKEQEESLTTQKEKSSNEIEKKKESFAKEKSEYVQNFIKKQDDFKLNSSRTEKEDTYSRNKTISLLKNEREELGQNNKIIVNDLEYAYKIKNIEAYKEIESQEKEQSETIEKAEEKKEKFEQVVNAKVTSVVTKEKSNNTQKLDTLVADYNNKITLKTTEMENFEDENSALSRQIEELLNELDIVQEKAHTLASKTIDSKSSTQSFEAMKDVAMEQARGKK